MKKLSKILMSLGLCVLLAVSCIGSIAFAKSNETYDNLNYEQYTYIGDSIPFGYGLTSQEISSEAFSVGTRVEGAYTDLVGDALEAAKGTKVQAAACSGSRLIDYRILLEAGMGIDDPYTAPDDWYGMRKPERTMQLRSMGPDICSYIQNSDLVTMQVGINDITGTLINAAYATGLVDFDKLENLSSVDGILDYIATVIENLSEDSDILGNFVTTFQKELWGIVINAQVVVKDVQLLAPEDGDIVIVGYNMAAQDLRVIPGTSRSLVFDLVDSALEALNTVLKAEATKYDNVYYCAAPDADIFYEKGTTVWECLKEPRNILYGVHPNAKGHQYIAKQVLNKLEEINA